MKNLPMTKNSRYKQTVLEVSEGIGYKGNKTTIRCMSSYETKAVKILRQLYLIKRINSWNSEEVIIPYISSIDGKPHRYYMDFLVETDKNIILIEVKPSSKTKKPFLRKNSTEKQVRNYHNQMKEYILNNDKWMAARQYCESMNQKPGNKKFLFQIWTEKELNI